MKSSLIFLLVFLFPILNFCQDKVGINKNPTQTLDVTGNINADGNYLINGQEGSSGQVLGINSNGNAQWVNLYKFDNIITLIAPLDISSTWSVPAEVTLIYIEVIGGGGFASYNGGGGGGFFRSLYATVSPGDMISNTVGSGGDIASIVSGAEGMGKSTSVTVNSLLFSTPGGLGGGGRPNDIPGSGGYAALNASKSFSAYGQSGTTNKIYYSYGPGGESVLTNEYSSGGGTYPHYIINEGGFRSEIPSLSSTLRNIGAPYRSTYGSGGASDSSLGDENKGEKGVVRIYY